MVHEGSGEGRNGRWKQRSEIERVKRKYVTLGWVQGLGDGEGASLFYFRLTRLCAPFLSVAPSLFHTMLFFLRCPPCADSLPPRSLLLSSKMCLGREERKGPDKFKGKTEEDRPRKEHSDSPQVITLKKVLQYPNLNISLK